MLKYQGQMNVRKEGNAEIELPPERGVNVFEMRV
jgi:hypothetical protein